MSVEIFDSLGSLGQISTISGYAQLRIFVEDYRLGGELQKLLDSGYSHDPKALAAQTRRAIHNHMPLKPVADILRSLAKLSDSAKDVVILK